MIRLMIRVGTGALSRARNIAYRALGVRMNGYVWMRGVEIPRNWKDISLGKHVSLDRGVVLLCSGSARTDKLVIGAGTYVNRYTMFDAHAQLIVGQDCMIGPYCYITDGNHSLGGRQGVKAQPMHAAPVHIEDEVWIGAHVVILPGVRIGRGAVIGAGSVVTSNIPAYAVAVGIPARVRRYRAESA